MTLQQSYKPLKEHNKRCKTNIFSEKFAIKKKGCTFAPRR